jgi:hypothetical protein
MEWNHEKPVSPDFDDASDLTLRHAVAYLRFHLATLSVFDAVFDMLLRALERPTHLTLFFCARIVSIVIDATKDVPAAPLIRAFLPHIAAFAPLAPAVDADLRAVLRIGAKLPPAEFASIVVDSAGLLHSRALVRLIVPLLQYFSAWELVQNGCGGALDLRDVGNWNFVTQGIAVMPPVKRAAYIANIVKLLPELLAGTAPKTREFELLVASFPLAALEWLGANDQAALRAEMLKRITPRIFRATEKRIIALKLESTLVKSNVKNMAIAMVFREEEWVMTLELKFPKVFPMEPLVLKAEVGDTAANVACERRIWEAIRENESVEAGVIEWHACVIKMLRDGPPCPVCFRYFDEARHQPAVKCLVCENVFHARCIKKWLERCLSPTCPYCGSPWKRAPS